MKLKLLLLLLFVANIVWAQEAYRNLVITEARMVSGEFNNSYLEITNMGDVPIDLNEIKIAKGFPRVLDLHTYSDWIADAEGFFFLPQSVSKVLQPGESYVMTIGLDFGLNMHKMRIPGYGNANRAKMHDIYQYADFIAHRGPEKDDIEEILYPHVKDSATWSPDSVYSMTHYVWPIGHLHLLNKGVWLEHHFVEGDSAVIDQVGNMFDDETGRNTGTAWDVAGVTEATANAILVRKSTITNGNLDFANARGVGLEDSEWLPLVPPVDQDNWRDTWWTVGNHGAFVLDANTLEPKTQDINVDFAGKTITVPWGIRRLDDIMRNMKYKPGVAWIYHLNDSKQDSVMRSAQTGDKLTVYVVGTTLYEATFDIIVKDPVPGDNIVVPIDHSNLDPGPITNNTQDGKIGWPRVTQNENGIDSITGGGWGLPNALRVDTLYKYLEKPADASWEIIPADGVGGADLRNGDILKVTASNGDVKEYFIEVQGYSPSHNANLSAITWPDIDLPEFDRIIDNWKGDTIPNFSPNGMNFRVKLPFDYESIPALVAKTEDLNSSVTVDRATSFEGSIEDRTISFEVNAEDDSVKRVYNVELAKAKNPAYVQPNFAEPFLSEIIFKTNGNNIFFEVCNPGNMAIDMSNYMFVSHNSVNPAEAIVKNMNVDSWINRYEKYVPGYKWLPDYQWAVTPGILEEDLNVNSIVYPGDVFCFGTINNDNHLTEGMVWNIPQELDVQFWNKDSKYDSYTNPWGEDVGLAPVPNTFTKIFYMFKILNDSVKSGLKPANDPNDFELIEAIGMADGSRWYVGGERVGQRVNYSRKPEYTKGNPVLQSSFGTDLDDSEWIVRDRPYYNSRGIGQPDDLYILESGLGQHFFNEPTQYLSTVTAVVYKVSPGYSMKENITGILTGTTATEFLGNIYKAHEDQSLKVVSALDGSELGMDAALSLNDTLIVLAADSTNTTKYILNVSDEGLSSNAVLTSERYQVEIQTQPKSGSEESQGMGTVSGFEYGTLLKVVLSNVNVPMGAKLTVIDNEGLYVPMKKMNYDTTYAGVTVNHNTYFEVVAENATTTITYQLQPEVTDNTAFITSEDYDVSGKNKLIRYVPRGTNVEKFLSNIIPSLGATLKLVDKLGFERMEGQIVQDDRLIVTSKNGEVQVVYFLSMLRNQYVPYTTYLAYITSNRYFVDQLDYIIKGVDGNTSVSDFYSRINPAVGAIAIVTDAEGNEKTSGEIARDDMVKVVSADGDVTTIYTFGNLTGVETEVYDQVQLYPNPTNGDLNVSGVKEGSRIRVYNSVGAIISDIKVHSSIEIISLNNQPAGMYMIVISDKEKMLGRYKALRK